MHWYDKYVLSNGLYNTEVSQDVTQLPQPLQEEEPVEKPPFQWQTVTEQPPAPKPLPQAEFSTLLSEYLADLDPEDFPSETMEIFNLRRDIDQISDVGVLSKRKEERIADILARKMSGHFSLWWLYTNQESKEIMKDYFDLGHEDINALLRGKRPYDPNTESRIENDAMMMIEALDRAYLPHALVVYRGTSSRTISEQWDSLETGGEFVDLGFLSATLSYAEAKSFTSSLNSRYILEIILPKGTNAAYVGREVVEDRVNEDEREVLIQNETPFIILDKQEIQAPMYSYVGRPNEKFRVLTLRAKIGTSIMSATTRDRIVVAYNFFKQRGPFMNSYQQRIMTDDLKYTPPKNKIFPKTPTLPRYIKNPRKYKNPLQRRRFT
tara:strand:- start:329 stop:1468 length:1140 start_codon:yes stop_codon:yes gene_type:complete